MKHLLLLLLLPLAVHAQGERPSAGRVMGGSGVPIINCNTSATRADVYVRTDVVPHTLYVCSSLPNGWTLISGGGGGGGAWGSIIGTITDQTDLVASLSLKANISSPVFTGQPTIPSFANAQHNHSTGPTGGQLNASTAFGSGTIPTARLGSGVADATTFLRGDNTWVVTGGGGGDMSLAAVQTVTGAKTYTDSKLLLAGADYGAADGSLPAGVEKALYLNTNALSRRLFLFHGGAYRTIFQAGVDLVNVTSNITGVTPVANGGTNNSTLAYTSLTDGATVTWTVAGLVNNATVTLAGNRTLAFSGLINGMTGTLIVRQDGVGTRTLTLPASSKVISGGAGVITLSTAANSVDILSFTYNGTDIFWTFGKNYN